MELDIRMKCSCCRRIPKENHEGVFIQGWLTSLKAKFTQEGRPCVMFICKDCLDAGKIEILEWNANRYPIRVREANGNLIIEAPVVDLDAGPPGPAAARAEVPPGHRPIDPLANVPRQSAPAAAPSQAAPQVSREEPKKTPPATPPPPVMPVQKPGVSPSGGACSKCQKEITLDQGKKSENTHGVKLCEECDKVETARIVKIMRENEAARKPLTAGLTVKAVTYCRECEGLVNTNEKKASNLFFGKSLCKVCFNKEKAAKEAAKT
jgi:hypothetical protein